VNGADYVRESLSIIEASLEASLHAPSYPETAGSSSPFTAARLAARIGYSVQHFSRLFHVLTGESPADYILKRRLTEAARRILLGSLSMSRIAESGGWSDYATFSRAFRRHFGVSPSQAKEASGLSLRFREPIAPSLIVGPGARTAEPTTSLSAPRLWEAEAFHLLGLPFFMDDSTPSYHRPWAIFERATKALPSALGSRIGKRGTCQFSSWLEDEETRGLFILCALEIAAPDDPEILNALPAPFVYRRLPPSTYLVFTHSGGVGSLRQSYEHIYGEALAGLDVKPSSAWELQRYPSPAEIQIAIPINPA
jgi:AraC family transcriptional regulator